MATINKGIYEFSIDDLVQAGALTADEGAWREHARIPYDDDTGLWRKLDDIDARIDAAFTAGQIKPLVRECLDIGAPYVRSDSINPIKGVDGKVRDSKSDYYKHLKDNKCHIVDYEQKPRTTLEGDFKPTKELKEAVQKHLNEPTKRKKR